MIVKLKDDRGRELLFGAAPKRIVSLVPSDTYNVAALGAASALVGRTDYCELPTEVVAALPSVGGTKNPRIEAIVDLEPDLVLANQEENTKRDVEALVTRGIPVWVAFPKRVIDGLSHLARLARALRVEGEPHVRSLFKQGYEGLREAEARKPLERGVRAFCPIWMEPLMTIHGDTFMSDMLRVAGADNVFAERERRYPLAADLGRAPALGSNEVAGRDVRYPRVTLDEVVARSPELVVLPDEPHPFTEEDAAVFRGLPIPAARHNAVVRTGGKDLSWYGARSVEGLARVRALVDSHRAMSGA